MALAGKPKFVVTYNGAAYEYEFDKGMTWAQFIASPYNTGNAFYNSGGYVKFNMYRQTVMNGNYAITAAAAIDPNIAYSVYIFDGQVFKNGLAKGWYTTSRCYSSNTNEDKPSSATFSSYPYLSAKLTVMKNYSMKQNIIPPAYLSNITAYASRVDITGRNYIQNTKVQTSLYVNSPNGKYAWLQFTTINSQSLYKYINTNQTAPYENNIYLYVNGNSFEGCGWEVSYIKLTLNNNR